MQWLQWRTAMVQKLIGNAALDGVKVLASTLTGTAFASINDRIVKYTEDREEVKAAPFNIFMDLDEAGFDFDQLPVIGVKTGNNPEHGEAWDTDKKKNVKFNAVQAFFDTTPTGQKWLEEIEDIKLAQKPETASQSKNYGHMVGDANYLKGELSKFQQRRTAGKSLWSNIALLYQQQQRVANMTGVLLKLNTFTNPKTGEKRIPTNAKYPFKLVDAEDQGIYKPLTIGEVNGLDFAWVKEELAKPSNKLSPYLLLINSLARDPKTPANAQPKIDGVTKLFAAIAAINSWVDPDADNTDAHIEQIKTMLRSKKGLELKLHIGLLVNALGPIHEEFGKGTYGRVTAQAAKDGKTVSEVIAEMKAKGEEDEAAAA